MWPEDHAFLLEHQARCQDLYKRAYYERLAELHAEALQKQAALRVEPTLRLSPRRALGGGLMGAGLGALGHMGLAAAGQGDLIDPRILVGGGAALGGLAGGFTQPADEELATELLRQQMQDEQDAMMEAYKTQIAGATV